MIALFIYLSISVIYCASSDTIIVFSPEMQKEIPTLIITPDLYESNRSSLNAVFLLHGYGGDYLNWSNHTNLEERADRFSMILICPDGSPNSWYMDSPIDSTSQYETFMIETLIPWFKDRYRINQMGITGLSMGGHGALYLAMRHPEVFSGVSSMSGGGDLTFSTVKWEITSKIGSFELYPERWKHHSIVHMVDSIQDGFMPILIDCGYKDFFIDINRALHNRLIKQNIPHTYIEKPGGHSWVYWVNALDEHLLFFQNRFR